MQLACATLQKISAHNLSYQQRVEFAHNKMAQKLFELIDRKQTNLAVAADVMTKKELLALADAVGPYICVLKMHCDIIEDFDADLIDQLLQLAQKHDFLICEDRKFADIGNTAQAQYHGGVHHISQWADFIIVHAVPGPGIVKALGTHKKAKEHGILLIAQLSSEGNLIDEQYTAKVRILAQEYALEIAGFVAQEGYSNDCGFITLTPGVNIQETGDALGQQYNSPQTVIEDNMSDIIIVGRGIYHATDPAAAAQKYQVAGWQAYQNRLNK
jgi:orotidine 5'-phosphate decarboxylase subfamily 1